MAKIAKKKPNQIEKIEQVDVHKIDEPIKVEAAMPTLPEVKVEEVIKPVMPQVIIVSGGQHVALEAIKIEGETFEEKVLNYTKGKGATIINDLLRIEFKDSLRLQRVNKGVRVKLQGLVDSGKIEVTGNAHQKLGGFFYSDNSNETQYHTVKNTRIEVTAL